MPSPVFLLTFAYNPTDALPEVVNELRIIQRLLTETGGNAEPIWQVTREDLERAFDTQRDDLHLFHYSGHAGPTGLQLNQDGQAMRISFAGGLARMAGMASKLKLVFLNGCSTADQAAAFLDRGVPAVIATSKPLADQYAVEFARRFYDNFTRRGSLNTLQQAFDIALDAFLEKHGEKANSLFDEQVRGIFNVSEEADRPLYELHIHPEKQIVGGQRFSQWFDTDPLPPDPDLERTPGNGPSPLRSKIHELVSKGRLEDALTELIKVSPDAIALNGEYTSSRREYHMNLIDGNEWRRISAHITQAVLRLAQEL
jgi:hypothetical protein